MKRIVAAMFIIALVVAPVSADTIVAGNHLLTPDSVTDVLIMAEDFSGVWITDLVLMISGGTGTSPTVTDITFLGIGGLYGPPPDSSESLPIDDPLGDGTQVYLGVYTSLGSTVSGSGPLAKVSIDTAGVGVGTWDLMLTRTVAGAGAPLISDTFGATMASHGALHEHGTLSVIPEPSGLAMLAGLTAALGICLWRRRKR